MTDNRASAAILQATNTIQKKLLGKRLTYPEIYQLMDQIAQERLSDVLTAYFVAASFKEGFTTQEMYSFTKAMVETGDRLQFPGIVADKHSIGGVAGTRATMILVPIIAAAGFTIPKISSRAITTPSGTADTMEVLAQVDFPKRHVEDMVNSIGGCICWNGKLNIAPADDVIIHAEKALSIESYDKIIISIMAKKIAASTNQLILDIPLGPTMKLRHEKDAVRVVERFTSLGRKFGVTVQGAITRTLEPAGQGVGPVLEARDVLMVLEQSEKRPMALEERALDLAGKLLDMCYKARKEKQSGREVAQRILASGEALKKFKEIVRAQNGDDAVTAQTLPHQAIACPILAQHQVCIKQIDNKNLNSVARILGAPRDKHAGIYLHKKTGDTCEKREPLLTLYSQDRYLLEEAEHTLRLFPVYQFKESL